MLPWIIWISYSPERVEGKTKLVVPVVITVEYSTLSFFFFVIGFLFTSCRKAITIKFIMQIIEDLLIHQSSYRNVAIC